MEIGSKGYIFLHPDSGKIKEICEILLGVGPISIPVSILWTCTSPLRFHQTIEDSNCLSLENRHFDFGHFLDDILLSGKRAENVQMHPDTVILLLQELGFAINVKKLVMIP